MTFYKSEVHGITRFDIYYNCYTDSSSVIENIHVAVAGNCSIAYSIFHLHVFKRKILLTFFQIMVC